MSEGLPAKFIEVLGLKEVRHDPKSGTYFCIISRTPNLTELVLILPPHSYLMAQNKPIARENILQLAGRCITTLPGLYSTYELGAGKMISLREGTMHVHWNPYDDESFSYIRLEGEISTLLNEQWIAQFLVVEDYDTSDLEAFIFKTQSQIAGHTLAVQDEFTKLTPDQINERLEGLPDTTDARTGKVAPWQVAQ